MVRREKKRQERGKKADAWRKKERFLERREAALETEESECRGRRWVFAERKEE